MQNRLIIGVMSGTSADGVDAALVQITGAGMSMTAQLVDFVETSYPATLKNSIQHLRHTQNSSLPDLARLGLDLSRAYVHAIRQLLAKTSLDPARIVACGCHGQTLFHQPPLTIQWLDPAYIAVNVGIDVIADFRRADCAAGGQGAPLVPFADWVLFKSQTSHTVLLNIGGIANLTILPKNAPVEQVIGFDTGPGNCISDYIMRDHGGMDDGGKIALSGKIHAPILQKLHSATYFALPFPKSTDGPAMIDIWKNADIDPHLSIPDRLATAAAWVGETIINGIQQAITQHPVRLIVAGGGVRNLAIIHHLRKWADRKQNSFHTTDDFNIPTQSREATAFAILAAATLDRLPTNIATGATRPTLLGALYPH